MGTVIIGSLTADYAESKPMIAALQAAANRQPASHHPRQQHIAGL